MLKLPRKFMMIDREGGGMDRETNEGDKKISRLGI